MLENLLADAPTLLLLVIICGCIVFLCKGADWMIDGVVDLAKRTGLPRMVIGATVISLGTTMPEAFVSVTAAYMGNPGLALGNGVGSIIADTGLIFGLTCLLVKVPVHKFILNRTGTIQVGAATLLVVLSVIARLTTSGEPTLARWVGVLFLLLLAGYLYLTYRWSVQSLVQDPHPRETGPEELSSLWLSWTMLLGGLALVIIGARILVPSASEIAFRFGIPEDIIAATLVAFGTSLPELMTAIASVRKGYPEIVVGNIVGADVLNCLFVIGAAACARPLAIPSNFFLFHFPAMLLILYSFRFFIFINKSGRFSRLSGAWLLGIYLVYVFLQYALNISLEHV
ncbi:MAG: sodium:calcium antiporter [Desulfohalobiaceae bacterium]|nr:sodium:calcium antiporter [Desulfohalobiaceae bacterium]